MMKQLPEKSYKKDVLKNLQFSLENTCVGVTLLKRDRNTDVFLLILPYF